MFGCYPQPPPKEEPEPEPEDEDELFGWRLTEFVNLGFDELVALALADAKVSPSDVRERFLKRGATHEQAARDLL